MLLACFMGFVLLMGAIHSCNSDPDPDRESDLEVDVGLGADGYDCFW